MPWVLKVENKLPREDRNTWRHNCVLLELATAVRRIIADVNGLPLSSARTINFIPAGKAPPRRQPPANLGILNDARDWICDFDLPDLHSTTPYHFPVNIDVGLRCDGYIISWSKRICIILELTVPMEEHIEYWHQVKMDKYGSLLLPGWTFHCFAIEIGCRGFVPPRFCSVTRRLGFSSADLKVLRDNLQMVARKCSYVIWLNRFNKDFNASIRITGGGYDLADMSVSDPNLLQLQLKPQQLQQQRITRNREAALLRLRASRNRRAAFLKLWMKKQPATIPSQHVSTPRLTLPISPPPATSLPPTTWSVLKSSGITLRNNRNNCWFHSTLYLLTSVPLIRTFCLSLPGNLGVFETRLFDAIRAIFNSGDPSTVASFFPLVKDCDGVQHRYGQIAVPDFIDYLCSRSTHLAKLLTFSLTTRLRCSKCHWTRYPSSTEVTLKLYFPPDNKFFTLEELVEYNSRVSLAGDNTVNCSKCGSSTPHTYLRSCNPDVFLIELVRITDTTQGLVKNNNPIRFLTDL